MDTTQIIYAALSIGGIGAILGAVLAFSSKVFHVPVDPKVEKISEILPQANCGACGFPGCSSYAEACAANTTKLNLCAPGGDEVTKKIADILGLEAEASTPMVVVCACQGSKENAKDKFEYSGPKSCSSAVLLSGGHKVCDYGCLGFGDCVTACNFDAIYIDEVTGLPVVDDDKCTGCGACVSACPKDVMKLIPKDAPVYLACNSLAKGKEVMDACKVGCIGCKICSLPKTTPSKAIKMVGNLPVIDYNIEYSLEGAKYKCPKSCFIEKGKSAEQFKAEKEGFKKAELVAVQAAKAKALEAKSVK